MKVAFSLVWQGGFEVPSMGLGQMASRALGCIGVQTAAF